MAGNNQRQISKQLSMSLSIFIALCVVSIFCTVSIILLENMDHLSDDNQVKRVHLPHHREFSDFIML